MTIVYEGSLPVSSVNLGLVASVDGLNAEVTKLTADISDLDVAVQGQLQVTANFPPSPTDFGAGVTAALNVAELTSRMAGLSAGIGIDITTDVALDLITVDAQIAAVETITASLETGLGAGGIAGWSYAGKADGFGSRLRDETSVGFSGIGAAETITAVVIATETYASWQSFAEGAAVSTKTATASERRLTYHGARTGAQWNTGTATLKARIDLFLAELRGRKAALEAQADLAIGLNLPDPTDLVNVGLDIFADVGITGLLDNLVNVQVDLDASADAIQAKIDFLVDLAAEIGGQLSAGGLSVWTYTGRADGLGAALAGETTGGLPGGSGRNAVIYGLALAGRASAMGDFGSIFLT